MSRPLTNREAGQPEATPRAGIGAVPTRERSQSVLALARITTDPTISDRVYEALRAAILEVDIYGAQPELRLDEKRLAEDFGVSRTPVREALARLEHEELVQIVSRRGVYIVRKSKAEIVEIITVWAALEGMAARLGTIRASDAEIGTLRGLFTMFEDGEVRTRIDEYSTANLQFHQGILDLSHSSLIASIAASLLVHVRAIRRQTIGDGDRADRSIVDHMHIIEALEQRDAELAERLVRDHALNLAAHVEQHVDHLD